MPDENKVIIMDTDQYVPTEILKAFYHVRGIFPEVTQVHFDKDCRWVYSDKHGVSPKFDKSYEVDTAILEDAADAVYSIGVPVTYKL